MKGWLRGKYGDLIVAGNGVKYLSSHGIVRRVMKNLNFCCLIFLVLLIGCSSNISLVTSKVLRDNNITAEDLRKITFYTDGQVIFIRDVDSFNSSRRAAANAAIRKNMATGSFDERVALKSNTAGFFHHMTNSHIFIQFLAGELVLPFKLEDATLDVSEIFYDGKKWEYEEGTARLIGRIHYR